MQLWVPLVVWRIPSYQFMQLNLQFSMQGFADRCFFSPFSFGHCIVCPSIYSFLVSSNFFLHSIKCLVTERKKIPFPHNVLCSTMSCSILNFPSTKKSIHFVDGHSRNIPVKFALKQLVFKRVMQNLPTRYRFYNTL